MDMISGDRIQALQEQIEAREDAIDSLAEKKLADIQDRQPIILNGEEYTFTDIISEQFDDQFIVLMHMAYIEMIKTKAQPSPHMKRFFDTAEELLIKACRDAVLYELGQYK